MKKLILICIVAICSSSVYSQNYLSAQEYEYMPEDTTILNYNIEESVIVMQSKDSRQLKAQPLSSTIIPNSSLKEQRIFSIKNFSSIVPNLYIPNYGSKITSSIYLRGIGSRTNSSSIGLYVDGIPYYDKSAFDFDYADVERIDVLRGPQGTLYGLNSMNGLINIYTKSPFTYYGTDLYLSAATKNEYRGSLTHYHRISDKFSFSAGGFVDKKGGYYKNSYTNKNIDNQLSSGGRIHASFLPSKEWKINLNVNYEYADAGGFPYGAYNKTTKEYSNPEYNYESLYYRNLLNSGLFAQYKDENLTLSMTTGFQHLKDKMKMDQDYTSQDFYTLDQMQMQNTFNQEFTLKHKIEFDNIFFSSIDMLWGASAFYLWQRTEAPISFGSMFISMLQSTMDRAMAASPVKVKLTDERMNIPSLFYTPTIGGALYHQSIVNDLFSLKGLSLTLGVRYDYERVNIKYDTETSLGYETYRGAIKIGDGSYNVRYIGKQSRHNDPFLPKYALKYEFSDEYLNRMNMYVSAAKGYRSGGYNIQMLSDYMQNDVQRNKGLLENDQTINDAIVYHPEYSWNYEAGSHLGFLGNRVTFEGSIFYSKVKNQQVARFIESGLGRYTSNAGKSHSKGFEISANGYILDNIDRWNVALSYGYTNAKFDENQEEFIGKKVPFTPENTLHVSTVYSLGIQSSTLKYINLYLAYNGLGKIYFTEANDVSQKFYATVNGRLSFDFDLGYNKSKGYARSFEVALWANNIFNKKYMLFYFDSGANGFMQRGRGVCGGVDLRFRF